MRSSLRLMLRMTEVWRRWNAMKPAASAAAHAKTFQSRLGLSGCVLWQATQVGPMMMGVT